MSESQQEQQEMEIHKIARELQVYAIQAFQSHLTNFRR